MSIEVNWNRVAELVEATFMPRIRDSVFAPGGLYERIGAASACARHGIGDEMIPNWDARWRPLEARRLWRKA